MTSYERDAELEFKIREALFYGCIEEARQLLNGVQQTALRYELTKLIFEAECQ